MLTVSYPDYYQVLDGLAEADLRNIISQITKHKEITDKIEQGIKTTKGYFNPFSIESKAEYNYPGTSFLGAYNLGVEISYATFNNRAVEKNPPVGFKVLIVATTESGLPLKLTLTGKQMECPVSILYPPKFVMVKGQQQYEDMTMDTFIRDIVSGIALQPDVSNYLLKALAQNSFRPYTISSAGLYPGTNHRANFSLTIEIPVETVNSGIVEVHSDKKFTAFVLAETVKSLPLLLTLNGEKI